MAHEELKALYEIDKQHSDTPWKYWEFNDLGKWVDRRTRPMWLKYCEYRRKPDAPVWDDDKEDARKWRELEAFYQGNGIMATAKKFLEIIEPKPALIQGYTAEQWQTIIGGEFLCEFSDVDFSLTSGPFIIGRLDEIKPWKEKRSFTGLSVGFVYCRPLRTKGVRQPWFGGDRPVSERAKVHCSCKDGRTLTYLARSIDWSVVTEFIEL